MKLVNAKTREATADLAPGKKHTSRLSLIGDLVWDEISYISVDKIRPFKNQARKSFSESEIDDMAITIQKYGVRQPLTVVSTNDDFFEVVSGERRLRAAKKCGLTKVPCIVLKDSSQAESIAIIENIQRKDLTPVELAIGLKKLLENGVFSSQSNMAEHLGMSRSKVSELISLSELPEDVLSQINENKLFSREHLRMFLGKASESEGIVQELKKNNELEQLKTNKTKRNFSVFRVSSKSGEFVIQDAGLKKMNDEEKGAFVCFLKSYINEI